MNLCAIILTTNLKDPNRSPKVLPKVCYKVGDKSILEICLEHVNRLNPSRIIIMVSKANIIFINKLLKHTAYSKLISYCITDNSKIENNKISLAEKCYSGKNILVIPANAPLLTSRSLHRILSENRNLKINDNIFYLKKEHHHKVDIISQFPDEKNILSIEEIRQIETSGDLDEIKSIFLEKKKIHDKILKRNR